MSVTKNSHILEPQSRSHNIHLSNFHKFCRLKAASKSNKRKWWCPLLNVCTWVTTSRHQSSSTFHSWHDEYCTQNQSSVRDFSQQHMPYLVQYLQITPHTCSPLLSDLGVPASPQSLLIVDCRREKKWTHVHFNILRVCRTTVMAQVYLQTQQSTAGPLFRDWRRGTDTTQQYINQSLMFCCDCCVSCQKTWHTQTQQ